MLVFEYILYSLDIVCNISFDYFLDFVDQVRVNLGMFICTLLDLLRWNAIKDNNTKRSHTSTLPHTHSWFSNPIGNSVAKLIRSDEN